MSNVISIKHNFKEISDSLALFVTDIGNKAMVRAVNKTVTQGRTQMARGINNDFRVKVNDVKDRLIVTKASVKAWNIEATLEAKLKRNGRSINLIEFTEKKSERSKRLKNPKLRNGANFRNALEIHFRIKQEGRSKSIPGAFIANKGRTMFIRTGGERLPIKALSTIDIPQMFNTRRINEGVRKYMIERFIPNLEKELQAILKGWAR